ncbi:helix-turn-helix domain-containing protein [Paenibacillus sp. p3-SID867]|uniref:helix-turn-helix domain-containing protein n=1 Tax=Paenibacillus sp. p3-SID867 TaxID=2916363 RepID=UPI0021A52D37|nr:helix-turn-helix transcriptional regulator [Paenibacillus sp. p3-SID867]MCT1402502.1 helix-turn-helix domain-containing protein [Paenibacillus sp. p3-SID867]
MARYFTELIRNDRNQLGYTLDEYAWKIGYTGHYFGKIERNEVTPSQKLLTILSNEYGYSLYTLIASLRGISGIPIQFGTDIRAQLLDDTEMKQLLLTQYYEIKANSKLKYDKEFPHLSAVTGISEERLEQIKSSFDKPGANISLDEATRICSAYNMRFSEVFVVSCCDIRNQKIGDLAFTIENYIERHRTEFIRSFSEFDDNLTEDEKVFLGEMLKSYRALKLKPQKDNEFLEPSHSDQR